LWRWNTAVSEYFTLVTVKYRGQWVFHPFEGEILRSVSISPFWGWNTAVSEYFTILTVKYRGQWVFHHFEGEIPQSVSISPFWGWNTAVSEYFTILTVKYCGQWVPPRTLGCVKLFEFDWYKHVYYYDYEVITMIDYWLLLLIFNTRMTSFIYSLFMYSYYVLLISSTYLLIFTNIYEYLRAPLTWTSDLKVKLSFQGLDLIFRSIRVQIRIPRGQIGQKQPFASFQIRSFSTSARACARRCTP
jgi:hypothetical protein